MELEPLNKISTPIEDDNIMLLRHARKASILCNGATTKLPTLKEDGDNISLLKHAFSRKYESIQGEKEWKRRRESGELNLEMLPKKNMRGHINGIRHINGTRPKSEYIDGLDDGGLDQEDLDDYEFPFNEYFNMMTIDEAMKY